MGSTSRLLSFLSGGIDSAVATWLMMRRGARVTAVHFHNRTHEGTAVLEKLEDVCGVLAWSAGRVPMLVVPFEACQRAIVGLVPAEYRMIVYRRAMFRIADELARTERALGFVTGDSLGQVASQTAENLRTIHDAATLPVYAPLIGTDKTEIVALARRIGTFDISIRPHADCCSFLIARHPATVSKVDRDPRAGGGRRLEGRRGRGGGRGRRRPSTCRTPPPSPASTPDADSSDLTRSTRLPSRGRRRRVKAEIGREWMFATSRRTACLRRPRRGS